MTEVRSPKSPPAALLPRALPEETVGPEAAGQPRFTLQIYRDWCKACGICAALCPKQVLGRDEEGRPVVLHPEACSGCGWCEIHCPDFAISVEAAAPPATEGEYA